jgi:hypothetical protein
VPLLASVTKTVNTAGRYTNCTLRLVTFTYREFLFEPALMWKNWMLLSWRHADPAVTLNSSWCLCSLCNSLYNSQVVCILQAVFCSVVTPCSLQGWLSWLAFLVVSLSILQEHFWKAERYYMLHVGSMLPPSVVSFIRPRLFISTSLPIHFSLSLSYWTLYTPNNWRFRKVNYKWTIRP